MTIYILHDIFELFVSLKYIKGWEAILTPAKEVMPMAYQAVFQRYELKYMLTLRQKERILKAMAPYMALDSYGRTLIRNLYFDTDTYRLIRRSIEKPAYKEKLRIRSYAKADPDSKVFVELKKKYESLVSKRRLSMPESQAMDWLWGGGGCGRTSQIAREIDYFRTYYRCLRPVVFLSYEREAYYTYRGDDFRVTFDDQMLCRQEDLSLCADVWGTPLLGEEQVLMEIKCSGAIPLWMVHTLSEERIYKTFFSKYGKAYETMIFPRITGGYKYA